MNEMLNAYRENSVANAEYSDPHRLISMLFDGAAEYLMRAIGHTERGEVARKGECLGRVVSIIDTLDASLDHGAGDGSIAANLASLYDYMQRRLTEANFENDAAKMREVHGLITEIRDGWNAIPPEARAQAASGNDAS
ncbi:flagellar export chaperone FliS [Wenzhouxiangella sp. AB-CW3]|uniref:flagellar export chaperone FliS n=1 Tax=Wenzhouxiangella sp. AB-CW3 TaxID=2771012 RepID=UPI00168B7351|nr:flagellar export chaperone FliS [Wenzhouxiangella sp. AB-CW3]QOC21213.1 flagellar export chaperone FliS [Wenzhouxiangella sp. AB-CW3]